MLRHGLRVVVDKNERGVRRSAFFRVGEESDGQCQRSRHKGGLGARLGKSNIIVNKLVSKNCYPRCSGCQQYVSAKECSSRQRGFFCLLLRL